MTETTDYERALRAEISAIRRIVAALDKLNPPTQERIVRYLADRYKTRGEDISEFHTVEVDPGDPHNDQIAAQAREELFQHVESARATLGQSRSRSAVMAVIAVALDVAEESMPRIRLALLLAAALIELAEPEGEPS